MRIVVAHESRALRKIFRKVLQGMGHPASDILEAEDGAKAAVALGGAGGTGLVVSDWELPGLRGMSFVRALQEAGILGRSKLLFLINRAQRPFVEEVRRIVPCEVLERPFTEEDFERKVRSMQGGEEGAEVLKAIVASAGAKSGLPFLLQLPSDLIDELLRSSVTSRHPAGAVLLRAGEVCAALHVVTEGEVDFGGRRAGEGDTFGEISFMKGEPSAASARARTGVQLASLSRPAAAALLQRRPRMAEHLAALLGRTTPATRGDTEFSGTLQTMPFADILQFLQLARKTGTLRLELGGQKGGIYLSDGEARHAWVAGKTGEEAFGVLASWASAIFSFVSGPRGDPPTLHRPTMSLLVEAMRKIDEAVGGTEKPTRFRVA